MGLVMRRPVKENYDPKPTHWRAVQHSLDQIESKVDGSTRRVRFVGTSFRSALEQRTQFLVRHRAVLKAAKVVLDFALIFALLTVFASVAKAGPHTVTLNWVASTTPGVTYNVLRSTTTGTETSLATGITAVTYVDSTVVAGQTYFYEVVAVDASNNASVPSNEVQAVVKPDAPTNPTILNSN